MFYLRRDRHSFAAWSLFFLGKGGGGAAYEIIMASNRRDALFFQILSLSEKGTFDRPSYRPKDVKKYLTAKREAWTF